MAVCPCEKVKAQSQGIIDGNCSLPLSPSCFGTLKPGLDTVNQHYCLDIFPVVLDKTSFPVRLKCPFHSSHMHGQDVCNISVVSDSGSSTQQCPPQLAFLSFLEVSQPTKNCTCLDAHWNCKNCTHLEMESSDSYSSCSVDIDIEKETLETPKTDVEPVGSAMKAEGALIRALRRKISLQIGGKIVQLLMNHCITLLKCTSRDKSMAEKAHDTPNNRWRRYKRTASFNSRKIVLFFSILSSMGTMVLIYLTLRVKQIGDELVRV